MKARTMRAIDWYVGVPLCYLLGLYERIRGIFPRRRGEVRNILFIKFFGIGSIVLSTPAVAAAQAAYPNAKIHYLTFSSNREILALLGCADYVHCIDTKSLWSFVISTLQTIYTLRQAQIDIVFDIEFFAKFPLIIATLISAKRKAGFYLTYEGWRRNLLDDLGYYNHYWHVKDIFLSLVYLVKEQDPYYVHFNEWTKRYVLAPAVIGTDTVERVRGVLVANGWNAGQKLIVLNPNAGKELAPILKRWPDERWAALASELVARYPGATLVCTGTSGEATFVENIIAGIAGPARERVRNGAGQFGLKDLLALFSLADLFVTIDSGPMHLASLTEVSIVGLFFAETPTLYAPLGPRARVVQSELYSVPSFTVYMGKDSLLPPRGTVAELVPVARVLDEIEAVFSTEGKMVKLGDFLPKSI